MTVHSTFAPEAQAPKVSQFAVDRFNNLIAHHRHAQIDLAVCDDEDEEAIDRLSDIAFAAAEKLLTQPAPSIAALAAKLEIIASEEHWDQHLLTAVVEDAIALAGLQQVPTFVAPVWVHYFQRRGGTIGLHNGKRTLTVPTEPSSAGEMLNNLTPWQRAAVNDHLASLPHQGEA